MKRPGSDAGLIFTWENPENENWWLAAFVFLSFLLHSAAFFLFQGKDPAPPQVIRTAPMVQILSDPPPGAARSSENDALLQWIAMQDPALTAKMQTFEPKGLLDIRYRASFETPRTPPLAMPLDPPVVQTPIARDPLTMIRSVSIPEKSAPATLPRQPTTVDFSSALQARLGSPPAIAPGITSRIIVHPTYIFAGVNADGEARFAFVQRSSGDPTLDQAALQFVRSVRFSPATVPMEWGNVLFMWGDDVAAKDR